MSIQPTRQRRAERTRAQIIHSAALAFAEKGFDGVSLNDLVRTSGLSKGSFYFHFPSKEDLALAVFRAKQQELISRLLDGGTQSASGLGRITTLLKRRAHLLSQDRSLGCVTRLGLELNVRFGSGSEYTQFQSLALDLIADVVRDGQRSRELRPDLDPKAAARTVFAWIVGIDALSLLFSGGRDLDERTDEGLDLLLPALATPTMRAHPSRGAKVHEDRFPPRAREEASHG